MSTTRNSDPAGRAARGGAEGSRPSILVVDDDPRNLTVAAEVLRELDAEIVCAGSGKEALRLLLQRDFCAILLDIRMPDMDGYETAALIRQRERSRHIPVIFLTAFDKQHAQVVRGYDAGAVDYIFKPVEPAVLRGKLGVFVELKRQSDEIQRKAAYEKRLLEENIRVRSGQVETERRLRATERREAMLVRSLPIAVYEAEPCEPQRRLFLRNENAAALLGFEPAEFEAHAELWFSRIHEGDREAVAHAIAAGAGAYSVEYRWRRAPDDYRYFLDQGVVVEGGGRGRYVVGTMLDVHERRLMAQQLVHAQKIEAVGKLTSGIAHDFNNMLTVVIGNLDRLRRAGSLDQRNVERVDMALQGALHCRDMTKRLLGFAAQSTSLQPEAVQLNGLIEGMADLFTRTLGERIEIRRDLAPDIWPVFIDRAQMEAAIANLLVNARDAMPDGGGVWIRTFNAGGEGVAPDCCPGLEAGCYAVLEVMDEGHGMPEEVLKRACEPFFTTKHTGRGTGLGLSTINDFARQSGGALHLASTPEKGTAVRILLPRLGDAAAAPGRQSDQRVDSGLPRARRREVVLVVEDDDAVRHMATTTLQELGYRVVEARNGALALEAQDETAELALLFTDLIMPGRLNGIELAAEARRRQPALKVLFTSAYGGETISAVEPGALQPFLRKPYREYELAQAIRKVLSDESQMVSE